MSAIETIWLFILIIPVAGSVVYGFINSKVVPALSVGVLLLTFVLSVWLNLSGTEWPVELTFHWISGLDLSLRIDRVSSALIALVVFISLLVHLFSMYYMENDPGKRRYYAKLGFFTFSMIGLLSADHLLLLFIFWELVGFSSYLLIGFWYQEEERAESARYSFMMNRIADAAFLSGILLWWIFTGNPTLSTLEPVQSGENWLIIATLGMLLGALGKSAQFPFFTWLPRAMAGPTPVSALIHAATMVAAGVYLLFRVALIFPDSIRLTAALLGVFTAFIAGYAAFTQTDIKKVLAYSTISQLGYMVLSVGVGALDMALFHLWTHAFFKAGLFLSAGAIIHFLSHQGNTDVQDMRKMGGLRKYLPFTFISYLICMLALSGLPLFTGFLSKDGIISAAWEFAIQNESSLGNWIYVLPDLAFLTAFLTAFYMGRQLLLVFFGEFKGRYIEKEKEPFITVGVPLGLLALGSLGLFYSLNPFGHYFPFLNYLMGGVEKEIPSISSYTAVISFFIGTGGLLLSLYLFRKNLLLFNQENRLIKLSLEAGYFDRLYQATLVRLYNKLSIDSGDIDRKLIDPFLDKVGVGIVVFSKLMDLVDKLIVDGIVIFIAWFSDKIGAFTRLFTATRVQLHVFWIVLSVVILLLWLKF